MKNGWQTKRLGEVCEIVKGRKPALKATASNGDLPYLVARVMRGSELAEYASVKDRNSIVVEETETIIICDGSNSGEVFTGFRGILSSTMGKISKKAEIDDDYLRAFLASTFEIFNGAKTGAAIPHLDKEAMYQLEFPLPPLPEQQRIVGILDEAFTGIATAKANAEKNLQNARALFESHLQSIFTQRGKGWVDRKLGDVFEIGSSKRIMESEWTSAGVPFYGGKEIVKLAKFGSVVSNNYISAEKYRDYASKYDMPRQDDILITARGTIGVGYIVQEGDKFYYKDGNIISMRGKTPTNPHFVLYAFRSNVMTDQFDDLAGTTVRHLPIEKAKELVLRMPEFAAQNSVVKDIRKIEAETQRLASIYERKLAALAALKKSLLNEAFTGKL
jgi:type I restriction enzyme S subunit